jgi:hypothetical protein
MKRIRVWKKLVILLLGLVFFTLSGTILSRDWNQNWEIRSLARVVTTEPMERIFGI